MGPADSEPAPGDPGDRLAPPPAAGREPSSPEAAPPPLATRAHRVAVGGLLVAAMAASIPTKSIPAAVIGLLLPPAQAGAVVVAYLFLGAIGLPVFPGLRAGVGMFFGPDGGFLIAPLFQALAVSGLHRRRPGREWRDLVPPLVIGNLVHVGMGSVGSVVLGGFPWKATALAAAVTLPWLGAKVLVAGAFYRAVEPRLPRM